MFKFGTLNLEDLSELNITEDSFKSYQSALQDRRLNNGKLLIIGEYVQEEQQEEETAVLEEAHNERAEDLARAAEHSSDTDNAKPASSWASLFRQANAAQKKESSASTISTTVRSSTGRQSFISSSQRRNSKSGKIPSAINTGSDSTSNAQPSKPQFINKLTRLEDFVTNFNPSFDSKLVVPRGLVNRGNMCFMNSIIQPLLHCVPLYNLLTTVGDLIPHDLSKGKKGHTLLDSIITLFKEFKLDDEHEFQTSFQGSEALSPDIIYESLHFEGADGAGESGSRGSLFRRGRQEDAEEFFGFLLDALHEEFTAPIIKQNQQPKFQFESSESLGSIESSISPSSPMSPNTYMTAPSRTSTTDENAVLGQQMATLQLQELQDNGGEWFEVGPKNKTMAVSRTFVSQESPITKIFGGCIRNVIKRPKEKDSVLIEPFHSLPLDISPKDVTNISDAIHNLAKTETLEAGATKQTLIDKLPPILVLHLKRFMFQNGKTVKLQKTIEVENKLQIPLEALSNTLKSSFSTKDSGIRYKLFAVVYHHGKSALDGHYTCDVLRQNGEWLHFDDTVVTSLGDRKNGTFNRSLDQTEYLLFYQKL